MSIFNFFFGPNPAQLHHDATAAAARHWEAAGKYTDRFLGLGPVQVRVFLCGSNEILRTEFFRRHGSHPPESIGEGYFWAGSGPKLDEHTETEIWLVEKDTGKNGIIQKWAAGHELMRLVNLLCRLQFKIEFGDAGKTDRAEFY